MPEGKSDLAELERAVRSAEDEVFRIQMADNFAFTNGNFDRAVRVLASARRELADAQVSVTLRFKGPGRSSEITQVCQPRQTVVPAMTPAWATSLEYEIAFTGGAFIQEATVQLIDLPAASAR